MQRKADPGWGLADGHAEESRNRGDPDQLNSEQRAILACTAIGVNHTAVGFTDRPMRLMMIRNLIAPKGNRYVLTETGRAVFDVLLERSRTE
jgi:hypothetical protein